VEEGCPLLQASRSRGTGGGVSPPGVKTSVKIEREEGASLLLVLKLRGTGKEGGMFLLLASKSKGTGKGKGASLLLALKLRGIGHPSSWHQN